MPEAQTAEKQGPFSL